MAQSTNMRLRALWLQVHKWIGICLAILIIPISITGAALVWHDWLDEQINPQRYAVTSSEARLTPRPICRRRPPRDQGRRARRRGRADPLSGGRRAGRSWSPAPGRNPARAAAARPAPASGSIPAPAHVLDSASSNSRPRPGHARPPRHDDGPGLGPDHRRLGRRVHVHLLPDRHLAVVADHRLASGAASAGSGRIRPTPISTTSSASGSCCRSPC